MKLLDWRDNQTELPRNGYYQRRDESIISMAIIHHTAGNGTVQQVNDYDITTFEGGAPHLAYHYFLPKEGGVVWANYHWEVSWHAANANIFSIGIAFQGNFEITHPTQKQLEALQWLLTEHLPANGLARLTRANVYGHGDRYLQAYGNNTACPGLNLRNRVIDYRVLGANFAMTATPSDNDQKLEAKYQENLWLGSKLYKALSADSSTEYLVCANGEIELNSSIGTTWVRPLGAEWGAAKIASGEIVRL